MFWLRNKENKSETSDVKPIFKKKWKKAEVVMVLFWFVNVITTVSYILKICKAWSMSLHFLL